MAINKKKETSDYATLMEMVQRIRNENLGKGKGEAPVPVSDTCYKVVFADICESKDKMLYFLRILTESHYIFTISLIEDEEANKMGGVYGYVVAEQTIIENLSESSKLGLEASYEQQFYKRSPAERIIRELLPQARMYNNTPIGKALNMSVMLQQFGKILRVDYEEFSDEWKQDKLQEILPSCIVDEAEQSIQNNTDTITPTQKTKEQDSSSSLRAVDNTEIELIQQMDRTGKWGLAVEKYGTQFLIRIHLRKYEFDKIRWLLRTNRIAKENDLRFIRDALRTMETRINIDLKLEKFKREMNEVRMATQLKLNAIHQLKKKK